MMKRAAIEKLYEVSSFAYAEDIANIYGNITSSSRSVIVSNFATMFAEWRWNGDLPRERGQRKPRLTVYRWVRGVYGRNKRDMHWACEVAAMSEEKPSRELGRRVEKCDLQCSADGSKSFANLGSLGERPQRKPGLTVRRWVRGIYGSSARVVGSLELINAIIAKARWEKTTRSRIVKGRNVVALNA